MGSLVPTPPPPPPEQRAHRWGLMRDVLVFQGKLLLDGLRDFLLGPIALVAGLIGILSNRDNPRGFFDEVIRMGRRSERWINLFGDTEEEKERASIDQLVAKVEATLKQQVDKGGMTKTAKERIDVWLDAIAAQQAKQNKNDRGK